MNGWGRDWILIEERVRVEVMDWIRVKPRVELELFQGSWCVGVSCVGWRTGK